MIGYKLQAITQYLLESNLCSSEQFDSVIENAQLQLSSQIKGNGIIIGRLEYQASLLIERYYQAPAVLFAHISAWLQTYDDNREDNDLPAPTVEIDNPCIESADVEINIPFSESIEIIQDDKGSIPFNGTTWSIAPIVIDSANKVAVGDNQAQPTDAPYES